MTDAASLQSLRMSRRFDASCERLFDAWTEPGLVARWLFTSPTSESHHATELDVRVGGRWTITDRREGVDYRAIGEYLQVERPRRLAFSFGMPQFSPGFTRVRVEFEPDGKGAIMRLTQEGLPLEAIAPTEDGWRGMFEGLAAVLAS